MIFDEINNEHNITAFTIVEAGWFVSVHIYYHLYLAKTFPGNGYRLTKMDNIFCVGFHIVSVNLYGRY